MHPAGTERDLNIFGAKPLTLAKKYTLARAIFGPLGMAAGIAVGVAYVAWQVTVVQDFLVEQDVWETGVATLADVEGEVKSNWFVFEEYDLKVTYDDEAGATHVQDVEFMTLFGSVDDDKDPIVKYRPDAPNEMALSWGIDVIKARWGAIGFMTLVGLLIGLSLFWLGLTGLRGLREARACASDSIDCALPVSVTVAKVNGVEQATYKVTLPTAPGEKERVLTQVWATGKHRPLFWGAEQQRVLCLLHRRDGVMKGLLIRDDFYPLVLGESVKAAAQDKVTAAAMERG